MPNSCPCHWGRMGSRRPARRSSPMRKECAVDLRSPQQLLGIIGFDTSPIEDANTVSDLGTKQQSDSLSDMSVHLLSLTRRGRLSSADGPDRFICEDKLLNLLGCEA